MREVLHTLFYLNRSGCQWDMLPHALLPKSTVYDYWTKSLRDSLGLTELVMLHGMRRCAALDRRRERAGRTPSLTGSKDRRTLVAWKERSDTILMLHKL